MSLCVMQTYRVHALLFYTHARPTSFRAKAGQFFFWLSLFIFPQTSDQAIIVINFFVTDYMEHETLAKSWTRMFHFLINKVCQAQHLNDCFNSHSLLHWSDMNRDNVSYAEIVVGKWTCLEHSIICTIYCP